MTQDRLQLVEVEPATLEAAALMAALDRDLRARYPEFDIQGIDATWCAGCKVEIPWFIDFERTYASRGLTVLGVSFDNDGWKHVRPHRRHAPRCGRQNRLPDRNRKASPRVDRPTDIMPAA